MIKQILLTLFIFGTNLFYAQTFDDKNISQLEELKIKAATSEKYELAAKYKKAIELKTAIELAVKEEDYEKANQLKNELIGLNPKNTSDKENIKFIFDDTIGELDCKDNNWRTKNLSKTHARFYGDRANEVHIADHIIYYGVDITYSKLIDRKNLGNGKSILDDKADHFNDYFNKLITVKDLQRWMKKPGMLKGTDIFSNYKAMNMDNFVIDKNYCLSFSDIKTIIKGYSLKEKNGIGMVINIANFNENFSEGKLKAFISLYITFFDIDTREILYAVEATGLSNIPTAFWHKKFAIGANLAVRNLFIDQIYLQGITSTDQLPEKFRLDN
ncbi:hypothetical protein KO494_14680 [Lacinutrix sp. C3R15]|uniref:hypothetical protein n=1 Tax=Flavobacteriaceae TaxID=49546 RepID=UPI001C08BEFA|nr:MULTISPECIES: hypothetical protein [Flavobacteriaceae]MBU2940791.1 hypothetical protein [Lacinutrix sp. C3R15]MDO6624109.1 hypothetical protein [Oceanihabitans sp. 1_MG-2023]